MRRAALRVTALDALTGLREVRAFAAEGRMLAAVQAKEAALLSAQQTMAGRTALAGAASFLCAQVAVLAVLIRRRDAPRCRDRRRLSRAGRVRGCGRPVARGRPRPPRIGRRAAGFGGRRRPCPGPRPQRPRCHPCWHCFAFRGGRVPLAGRSSPGVRWPDPGCSTGRARRSVGSVRCGDGPWRLLP